MTKLIEEYIAAFEERWPLPKVLAFSGGKGVERDQQIMRLREALTASFEAGKAEGKGEVLKGAAIFDNAQAEIRGVPFEKVYIVPMAPSQTTSSECPICGSDGFCGCWKDV